MYQYRAQLLRVVDGDTVDAMIDLGFDIHIKKRIRLVGIDAWESRTRDLEEKAKLMLNGMKEIMHSYGIPFSTNQIGGMFGFFFSEELPKNIDDVSKTNDEMFSSFINSCIENGIYFAPSKYEAGFISTMHKDIEINKTIEVVNNIIKAGDFNK